ncbi:hypothetical protein SAMN05216257_101603 [Meinhardsimonia xiamenensis]|jgi:hypothetical protein|uniref:Uncharacterized protein n=1 Tax=Meinhardsimonia xiamenensis TaxID=990712 RepID=A0A1G8Z6X2_9RHOB|nr:hypothetical protein [Meinhardsimonia xiamenensis]PRX37578.1 hypothetical protein LV81_01358 [Meinhardsimonia xiamenensis]SDK10768.1 hypothetical protein SAMN05216257_101603 [Meinhardsimonia xiamenensis]
MTRRADRAGAARLGRGGAFATLALEQIRNPALRSYVSEQLSMARNERDLAAALMILIENIGWADQDEQRRRWGPH